MTAPALKEPEVLTPGEVAGMLRISVRTVFRLNLPSVKLGRKRLYLRETIMGYLREKET